MPNQNAPANGQPDGSASGGSSAPAVIRDVIAQPAPDDDSTALAETIDATAEIITPPKPKAPTYNSPTELREAMEAATAAGTHFLTAKEILAKHDFTYRVVETPEWGGSVIVRGGSGEERDAFEASLVIVKGKTRTMTTTNIRAKLCQKSMVDPTDPDLFRQQFTEKQVRELGAKSASALSRVYNAASELWGLNDDDVEELAGNSGTVVSDG